MRSTFFGVVLGFIFATLIAAPVFAKPKFLEHLRQYYGLGESTKCTTCHEVKRSEKPGKKNLGAFGKDYQAALNSIGKDNLNAVVKSLEDKDSDGDGATNVEEIRLGSLPGDSNSTPNKDLLEKFRAVMAKNASNAKKK